MKLLIATISALMICVSLSAQSDRYEQPKTLFDNDRPMHNGGYGAIVTKYGKVLDQDAYFMGIRGGWIANRRFALGIAGNGLVSRVVNDAWLPEHPDPNTEARLITGYGGILLEPIIFHNEVVHASFPITIGAGGATYGIWNTKYWGEVDVPHSTGEAFFALEPGIELEINALRWMRINIGATYLYTSDILLPDVEPDFMRGWRASFGLKFGGF